MSAAVRAAASVLPAVPRGLGDRRAAQEVYRRLLRDQEGVTVSGRVGHANMRLRLDDWPQAQAYLLRRYDPSTVAFVDAHLPGGGVFVDGGAHIGLISLQVARMNPSAEVHAFEPHPEKHAALEHNIALNGARVRAVNSGLSDSNARAPYDPQRHAVDETASESIGVMTLDSYAEQNLIDRIDVLKLDVEGHEAAALRGGGGLLRDRAIRAITMESLHGDTNEPMKLLELFGYERVAMPDARPRWLSARRPMPVENVGYVAR